MRLRVYVYGCTSDEFCAEEREYVLRTQRVSVKKSESECRDVKQNRVRVARKRTECIKNCEN